MSENPYNQTLRILLLLFGVVFIIGIWPLMQLWPSGFQWQPGQPEYEQMIVGIYAVLGVFLILASRAPHEHRSLILFTAWSSIVHAGIMAIQALRDTAERGHFLGDIPILAITGVILLVLLPRRTAAS